MGFSSQEYQSALPFHSPGDLPDPGVESAFSVSCFGRQVLHPEPPGKPDYRTRVLQTCGKSWEIGSYSVGGSKKSH